MKKIGKDELYKLLNNKGNKTFKQLSDLSGYHDKYLIKIYPKVINNEVPKKSKKRIAYNKIDENIVLNLKNSYLESSITNKKKFYNFLKENNIYTPSYSKLCTILKEEKKHEDMCVATKYIINGNPIYVVFDYETLNILFVLDDESNNKDAFHTILSTLIKNYGAPKFMACDSLFSHNKEYYKTYLKEFSIKSIGDVYEIRGAKRKIRKQLMFFDPNKKIKKRYRLCKYDKISFYFRKNVYINENFTFQFHNTIYKVNNNSILKGKAEIYYDKENVVIQVIQNNVISQVSIIKKVISKKGLTKY